MSQVALGVFVLFSLSGVICLETAVHGRVPSNSWHGPWQAWRQCTKSCGGGTRWRFRRCSRTTLFYQCYQTQSCNTHPCGVVRDGRWSWWGRWGPCSKTCGGGYHLRRRTCTNPPPAYGGRYCKGSSVQVRKCGTKKCGCITGSYVYSKCGERCRCYFGILIQCVRIRKEFTSMTTAERRRYIRTIKKASTHPTYKSQYDALITLHRNNFVQGIHTTKEFLPWHRWYLLQYENLLRQVDCKFTLAYWDWVSVAGSPWGTASTDLWYYETSGFGGNGQPAGQCVQTGPFRDPWKLVPSADPPRCLKRNFNGNPPGEVELALLLNIPPANFVDFEDMLSGFFHDNVHCLIDGTMCTLDAASAPEFFLHHGLIDKIWEDWQKKSNAHRIVYFSGINDAMTATGGLLPGAVLHSTALPGGVRVVYAEKNDLPLRKLNKKLRSMSKLQLQSIPRAGSTPLSKKAIKLFRMKNSKVKRIMQLTEKMLRPRVRKHPSSKASSLDRKLGFSAEKVEAMKSKVAIALPGKISSA